jgi:carbon storage regulator
MLVVTRKVNEGIVIDGEIRVVVVGVEDGKVKLGIDAPRDKGIYRQEIYEVIKQENREAATADKTALDHLPRVK